MNSEGKLVRKEVRGDSKRQPKPSRDLPYGASYGHEGKGFIVELAHRGTVNDCRLAGDAEVAMFGAHVRGKLLPLKDGFDRQAQHEATWTERLGGAGLRRSVRRALRYLLNRNGVTQDELDAMDPGKVGRLLAGLIEKTMPKAPAHIRAGMIAFDAMVRDGKKNPAARAAMSEVMA